jgi:hypothetical protein
MVRKSRLKGGCSQDWLPHNSLRRYPSLHDNLARIEGTGSYRAV